MSANGTDAILTWMTTLSRYYTVEKVQAPTNNAPWADSGLGLLTPDNSGRMTRTVVTNGISRLFMRVRAHRPLMP